VRVAILDGRVQGFSLLEDSTLGLQYNEHPNSFEAETLLEPVDPRAGGVHRALVEDAVAFYRAKGLSYSVAVVDERRAKPYLAAGFTLESKLRSLTVHRSLIRSWIDVWNLLFANRREWLPGETREDEASP
jgi:hypothetical protein